ncbi:MAG: hypothetical protein U0228_10410 [Myxococcaceae bacterium]
MTLALAVVRRGHHRVSPRVHAFEPPDGPLGVALEGYRARADRVVRWSVAVAVLAAACSAWWSPALIIAVLAALGASFDRARARLGATVQLEQDRALVTAGAHRGLVLTKTDLEDVGFGAPASTDESRAPETFWRGDFQSAGHSHLVVVRLVAQPGRPRRLILVEDSIAAARRTVARLEQWRAGRA